MACSTQWRIGPTGQLVGLDYRAAKLAAKGLGIRWRDAFGGLQTIEEGVLAAQSESS